MKVLLLTSAHNSMSQRAWVELTERGHDVSVELALGEQEMVNAPRIFQPDLIVAPMLRKAIPESVWRSYPCIVVHPGIEGDRGPSSLDWAILEGEATWGVTLLQANQEMDAGDIWSTRTFPMRAASKSSIYRNEVLEAATACLLETVSRFEGGVFKPRPLDYGRPGVRGRLRPLMKQQSRAFDWSEPTESIARKIRSADGAPGVLTRIGDQDYYLYGAHEEDELRGKPGFLLARRGDAVCFGTGDGALWISHVKRNSDKERTFKLPATMALAGELAHVPEAPLPIDAASKGRTYREIRYYERGDVGCLEFEFGSGAMSTRQCRELVEAIRHAKGRKTRALVLFGGYDYWCNGIHLNVIESAEDPAEESFRNLNAIDDVVREIVLTESHLTIAAMQGTAGAGGVILALAADRVYARTGLVLNPHYKSMGGLYGSEYWTYLLPRRVGVDKARELTERCLPLGAAAAHRIGLVDDTFGHDVPSFRAEVLDRAARLVASPELPFMLERKRTQRREDEAKKPLDVYRDEELARAWENFFGADRSYHQARRNFVLKLPPAETPRRFALHRC